MKASNRVLVFLIPVVLLQFMGCDTPRTIESPEKNYFVKFYGDEGAHTGVDMVVNTDGTIILLGTITAPNKRTLLYVVKVDEFGNSLWKTTLGDTLLDHEAKDIELMRNGSLVILGNVVTTPGNRDIELIILDQSSAKTDNVVVGFKTSSGGVLGAGPEADEDAVSVTETNDGFIVAGSTGHLQTTIPGANREGLFARFLNNPLQLAPNPFQYPPSLGQGTVNVISKIVQLPNNKGFYAFGYTNWRGGVQPDFDFWYFGLSDDGKASLGALNLGSPGTDEKLMSVAEPWPIQTDSSFFLGGIITDLSGNDDIYIAKLVANLTFDSVGSSDLLIAPKSLGVNLLQPKLEWISGCHTLNSGYLVLTNENSTGNSNLLLTKINEFDGQIAWTIPLIYGGVGDDFAGAVRELPDGKIVIVGTMAIGQKDGETKMVLMKMNKEGRFAD